MVISINAEKAPNKISFHDKNIQQLGHRRNTDQCNKGLYDKTTTNIILNGKMLKVFVLRSGITRMPTFSTPIKYSTGSPSQSN